MSKFTATATASYITISMRVETKEAAQAIAAQFPKSVKAIATTINIIGGTDRQGCIDIEARIGANGVNGGKNETGIKRIKSALKTITALGYEFEYTMPWTNSLTEAEFWEAVA